MIVLDTNVISELARPHPYPAVQAWADGMPLAKLCTTAITEAELCFGLALLPPGRRHADLARAVEAVFTTWSAAGCCRSTGPPPKLRRVGGRAQTRRAPTRHRRPADRRHRGGAPARGDRHPRCRALRGVWRPGDQSVGRGLMADRARPGAGGAPALPAREAHPLSDAALAYARQALSPATRRAYASHLRAWENWCRDKGVPPAPAAPSLVANHLAELAGQRAYATLTGRLPRSPRRTPCSACPSTRATRRSQDLQGIARGHGTRPQRRAAPLLTADVIRVASVCGGSLRGERDRALILLGFAGAFRRSELVALRVAELSFGPHGLSVLLPRSKSDQEGQGSIVHVAANPLAAHCPVAALRAWLTRPRSGTAGCSGASPAPTRSDAIPSQPRASG